VTWRSGERIERTKHLRVVDENASWSRAEELARLIGRDGLLRLDHNSLGMCPGKPKWNEDCRGWEGKGRQGEGADRGRWYQGQMSDVYSSGAFRLKRRCTVVPQHRNLLMQAMCVQHASKSFQENKRMRGRLIGCQGKDFAREHFMLRDHEPAEIRSTVAGEGLPT